MNDTIYYILYYYRSFICNIYQYVIILGKLLIHTQRFFYIFFLEPLRKEKPLKAVDIFDI